MGILIVVCSFSVVLSFFPLTYEGLAVRYGREYGIDVDLVLAVILVESGGDPNAISAKGAIGLMQLMPDTARWLAGRVGIEFSDDDLLVPDVNVRLGTAYLAYLMTKFEGDYVLAAYNAGEGNVLRWLESDGKIAFSETGAYVNKVKLARTAYSCKRDILGLVV